ncbi:uncharacterized protein RHOBADRAFT_66368, partial [Rhodotorula graminis WP1]
SARPSLLAPLGPNPSVLRSCRSASTMATGWIDDVNLLEWGKTVSLVIVYLDGNGARFGPA